jgi:hypothetical protein
MNQDWSIQGRSHACSASGREFAEGEFFYTLLFDETAGFRREDWCEEAFKARPADAPEPFSLWRAKYQPPAPPPPEPLGKHSAEDLLRRYMDEQTPQHTNARYLLAVMLERKRLLKEVEVKKADDGRLTRIYEHSKTGEVFVVPDPGLKLEQLAALQVELSSLLSPETAPSAPAPEPPAAPEPAPASPQP